MTIMQALLLALWAGICSLDDLGAQMFRRPLLISPIVGLILGDVNQGLIIGATLELTWMGVGNVGAYSAPDLISGAIVGTAVGISSGGGIATSIALAVPTSLLCQQFLVLQRSFGVVFNKWGDKVAESGDFNQIDKITVASSIVTFLVRALPVFVGVYFGSEVVERIVSALPQFVMSGLSVSSKILPAIGISMLLLMMKKGILWGFLVLGFTLASYLGLGVLPITLISIPFAIIIDMIENRQMSQTVVNSIGSNIEEGEYDL